MKKLHSKKIWMASAALIACMPSFATEGGGSTYPSGVENFLMGAAPPPGVYALVYGNVYSASQLKDNSGNTVPIPGFKVRANVISPRVIWSTPYQMLGGNLVFHAIFPLIDLKVQAAGASQGKSGLGDITLGVFGLAHHYSPSLHSVVALDVVLPTGSYQSTDLANLGRNYVSFQPLYTMSLINPKGLNGDFKATLNLNRKNSDTQYKSGNEFFLDYSLGWGLGNGWTVGAGGHLRNQIDNDKLNGVTIVGNKARSYSIGPSIKYDNGKGFFITAKYQTESGVRNTTKGDAFWVKASIPF
jgi:hypothetical protein